MDKKSDKLLKPSAYETLKNSDFRLLLAGRLFATVSFQIQAMAVGWQIYELTKNPLMLGFIGLAEALPSLSITLYAGHVADMVDRRRLAIWTCLTLFLCMLFLAVSTITITRHDTLLVSIFVLIALSGFARGFFIPVLFGMMSDIIPRELLSNASAWNTVNWQASAMLGPIIGGFLYFRFHAAATYEASTVLMIATAFCFWLIKVRSTLNKKEDVSVIENIREGVDFVFSNQIVLGAMALDLFAVLFGGAVALLPIFTDEIFHEGPEALGMLRAAPAVGACITAYILAHKPITTNAGRVFLVVVAGYGLCMIAFGLSRNLYISMALLALSGVLDGISVYIRTTIYQLLTPLEMKGRVAAVNNIFIGSSNEIGEFESGVAAKIMGLVPSVIFGGCMTLLVVLIAALKAPRLRKLHMQRLFKEQPVN